MADTITIPDSLRAKAQEKGWPEDLVQQALGAGASAEQIIGYMDQGVSAEQARGFLAAQAGGGRTCRTRSRPRRRSRVGRKI